MQHPEEYENFFKKYSVNDIGINLNIGHLNLAANAFKFDRIEFINLIEKYILAIEFSHNDGTEDDHLPLKDNQWYSSLIEDKRFKNSYKILEFRNTPIEKICQNIDLVFKNN